MTVALHPDDRRLLQEVAALLRGLMAAIPRPMPAKEEPLEPKPGAINRRHTSESIAMLSAARAEGASEMEPRHLYGDPSKIACPVCHWREVGHIPPCKEPEMDDTGPGGCDMRTHMESEGACCVEKEPEAGGGRDACVLAGEDQIGYCRVHNHYPGKERGE